MLINKNILIIGNTWDVTKSMFWDKNKENNIDVVYNYNKLKRILGKISDKYLLSNLPGKSAFFYFRKYNLNKYDLIILFECHYPQYILQYLRRKNKNAKIVYWLWNSVENINSDSCNTVEEIKKLVILQKKYNYSIYSFDKLDCKKYKFKYNNQVLKIYGIKDKEKKYDTFFCGRDKSRMNILIELYKQLSKINLNNKFLVYPDKDKEYSLLEQNFLMEKGINYEQILKYIDESKCIIDIIQEFQGTLTWRPLEAMFYRKKLITNFKDIKEYDFYKKDNIFIIGEDDPSNIKNFVNTGYVDIPQNIIKKYTIDGWIENFLYGEKNEKK